jgi:hypothetical protein
MNMVLINEPKRKAASFVLQVMMRLFLFCAICILVPPPLPVPSFALPHRLAAMADALLVIGNVNLHLLPLPSPFFALHLPLRLVAVTKALLGMVDIDMLCSPLQVSTLPEIELIDTSCGIALYVLHSMSASMVSHPTSRNQAQVNNALVKKQPGVANKSTLFATLVTQYYLSLQALKHPSPRVPL